jgi:UTP--glucose-1-phosphate uridylyltransferase
VGLARHHVGQESFAVLLPDDLMTPGSTLLRRMIAASEQTGGPVVALKRFLPSEISQYGVVVPGGEVDDSGLVPVRSLVEKPAAEDAPSDLAVMGRYVLTPEVFGAIDRITPGKGGELQLTDALELLAAEGPLHGIVFDEGRYDTGNKLDWLRATVELSLQDDALGPSFREVLLDIVRRAGLV